jgi:hypothetical protein
MNRTLASALLCAALVAPPGGAAPALARKAPRCGSGTWLLVNPSVPELGEVTVRGENVAIGTVCQVTRGAIRTTTKGTVVRATAASCAGFKGKVRLRALIDPTCRQMTGTITGRRAHVVEAVSACGGTDAAGEAPGSCPTLHHVNVVVVGQCAVDFGVGSPGDDPSSATRGVRVCAPARGARDCHGWFLEQERVIFAAKTVDVPFESVLTGPDRGRSAAAWVFAGWSGDCASSSPISSAVVSSGRATAATADRDITCTATCIRRTTTTSTTLFAGGA